MAQISVEGQVISEIELKTSAKNNPYVRFEIVEYIGKGEKQRAQYFHVCAFAEHALGIVNADIYEEGMVERVNASDEAANAYYDEQDAEKFKERVEENR